MFHRVFAWIYRYAQMQKDLSLSHEIFLVSFFPLSLCRSLALTISLLSTSAIFLRWKERERKKMSRYYHCDKCQNTVVVSMLKEAKKDEYQCINTLCSPCILSSLLFAKMTCWVLLTTIDVAIVIHRFCRSWCHLVIN